MLHGRSLFFKYAYLSGPYFLRIPDTTVSPQDYLALFHLVIYDAFCLLLPEGKS